MESSIGGQVEHQVGEDRSGAAAENLGDDVDTGVGGGDRAVSAGDERHGGVEVGTRHGTEDQDQRDQRRAGCGRVLQQLQADIGGRQALGHDPGPDHGHDQQTGAERLGDEATRSLTAGSVTHVQASAGSMHRRSPHDMAGASASTV